MTLLHVYTRNSWRAREPVASREVHQSAPTQAFLHHSADPDGRAFNTLDRQKAHMRSVQDFHMGPERKWADIGYHLVVFQFIGHDYRHVPRVFAGRPVDVVPAAQLDYNTGTLAICVAGNGDKETLTPETEKLIAALIRQHPTVRLLRPHSANPQHPGETDCPGAHFRDAIPAIARLAGVRHA